MDESELQDFRRKRLAEWLRANGGARAVCQRRGLQKSAESFISQVLRGETFGQKAARNMEFRLGMDAGYLDDTGHSKPMPSPMAMELAWLFDDVVKGMGPRDRSYVYHAAQEAITREPGRPAFPPSDTPARSDSPEKRHA